MLLCVGCGKKGAPLPPLVKLPVPPADLAATRRGDTVDLFPAHYEDKAWRIEMFGDEIESIV